LLLASFAKSSKISPMSIVTMNISLTGDLKSFVDTRIAKRGYSSASEYMRDLIRRDEERASEERFKSLIEDGLNSPLMPEGFNLNTYLDEHLQQAKAKRKKSKT
jgi:antitoxin ParD1/3/4